MLNLCEQQELVRQQREQMQQIQQLKCSRRQEQHDTPVQQPQLLLQQQSAEYKSYDKHCARAPSCSEVKTEDRPSGRTSTGSYDTIRDNDEKLAYRINQAEEPVSLQKRAVCDVSAPNKRQKQNDHTIRVGK